MVKLFRITSGLIPLAAGLLLIAPANSGRVRLGVEVLIAQNYAPLVGKRVGLITNHTGRTATGESTIDVLAQAPGVKLVALFAPEHGLEGTIEGRPVPAGCEPRTGLPIHSLYGATLRPTDAMLAEVDVLVFDIQDAGVRFYTYITTMAYAMEEAARRKIAFVVLDRPNPLNGLAVQGPMLDPGCSSFVGYFPMPIRHGMTVGELAQMFNAENKISADLTVIPLQGWRRELWFDETGLEWIRPSPNLCSLRGATLYPAIELLRAGGVSVGRGTATPFELSGAPWIRSEELLSYLRSRNIPGVHFEPVHFQPSKDVHAGEVCYGLRLQTTDRSRLDIGWLGVELLAALHKFYPQEFRLEKTLHLLGSTRTLERIRAQDDPREIVAGWEAELEAFKRLRRRYLLYD